MIYQDEYAFVEKIIAGFKVLGVQRIPFSTYQYADGVAKMSSYLETNLNRSCYRAISLLFTHTESQQEIKYQRLENVFDDLNGWGISFAIKNPSFEIADITLSQKDAEKYLLDNRKININEDIIINAAKAFCDGAKVELNYSVTNEHTH